MFARRIAALFCTGVCCFAETHPLTLPQVLEVAARQNPEVVLARLDQQRADQGVTVAKDPFRPKVFVGSGLAYTYGYPNSIDGNAPSLAQFRADMYLYNRPKSYNLATARELARGSEYGVQTKADDIAFQAADLFLTANQLEHQSKSISDQIPSLQKVVGVVGASVEEGRNLPLELKRAQVNLAMSQQRLEGTQSDSDYYEMMLAVALGFSAKDRVKPVDSDLSGLGSMPEEQQASDKILQENRELKQMQSNLLAKELDVKSYHAARLPQIGLVAQYAYFAKYNYAQYFQKFQHNNFQLGASVAIPILVGAGVKGQEQQSLTDLQKLRVQMDQVRNRLISDTHRTYDVWRKAQSIRTLARMQLDLAREDLTVKLAQNAEGRILVSQLEQVRLEESNRWMAFYEADAQEVRARLAILKQTGNLLAAVRALPAVPASPGVPTQQ